ncbi:hypothetical protein THII_0761 [Thioploca ingrica]|uniref:DUF2142 domain-containing protein n=1 Tax=Thioploca ingrica TaxID=40754 RepID=A0A090ABP0_9GAMM|nr:hypothetical protein THII_0761 [Thioploca ingrica]
MICLQKPESVFILFGLIFGILVILITPPFQVPDEQRHFFRALQISQGDLIPTIRGQIAGAFIPAHAIATGCELADYLKFKPQNKQSFEKLAYFLNLPPLPEQKQFTKSNIVYSPLPYLPQVLGISIGKTFHLSWLKTMYLGRLSALIVWLSCVYIAIKLIPISKWLLCLLALSPMAIFQAASLSTDSLIIAVCFLFISILLKIAVDKEINSSQLWVLLILLFNLAIFISLSKPNYAFIIFLFFLIPVNKLGGNKYGWFFLLMLLSSISTIATWSYLTRDIYATIYSWRHLPPGQIISSSEQLKFVLSHPLQYLEILISTTYLQKIFLIKSFIGNLGWLDTSLPRWLLFLHSIMLIGYALTDSKSEITFLFAQKVIIALVWLGAAVLIYTSMYFSFTPVGNKVVEGVQGRYFIPIGILFFLLFYNNYFQIKQKALLYITISYVPLLLTTMLAVLINRYYVQLF